MSESLTRKEYEAIAANLTLPVNAFNVAANWLSAFTGDRAEAASYLAGLIGAYCRLLTQETGTDLAQLRAGLGTAGGLNQYLSRRLADNGTLAALEGGLDGLRQRLQLPPKI